MSNLDSPVRVLIADDHPIFRDGLRILLDSMEDVIVVGDAADGFSAVEQALALRPNLVLMDIKMPGLNGIEATAQIVLAAPDVRVLMLTMFEAADAIFAAMRAGASGYLLKGARQDEVRRAILSVAHGEIIFDAQIAGLVRQYFVSAAPPVAEDAFPQLSGRELEILDLLAQQLSNTQIAERLVVSHKTIRNHVSNIFHKLHVAGRSDAIRAARAAGLGRENG